jgi:hypothetical protein
LKQLYRRFVRLEGCSQVSNNAYLPPNEYSTFRKAPIRLSNILLVPRHVGHGGLPIVG